MPLSPEQAADRFGRLAASKDGEPVVVLLGDPDLSEGFLSVVKNGANARRFQVAKAELDELHPANTGAISTTADQDEAQGWLRRIFGNVFALMGGETASKSGPTTFDAAVGVPVLYDALWLAHDGLVTVIGNVLRDEEVLDKSAKLRAAIDAHRDFLVAHLEKLPTLKADQVIQVAELSRVGELDTLLERAKSIGSKVSRVIEDGDRGRLIRTKAILQTAVDALEPEPGPPLFPDLNLQEDDMNVQAVAQAAAQTAVQAAKAAGVNDPMKLAEIASAASTEVFKAAVSGPSQPALAADNLARQRAAAGGESGSGWSAEGALLSAISSGGGSMVMKTEDGKARTVKSYDGKAVELADDKDGLKWLVETARKGVELREELFGDGTEGNPGRLGATESVLGSIAKALGVAEPTAQGTGEETKTPVAKTEDGKPARDASFDGSALSFS